MFGSKDGNEAEWTEVSCCLSMGFGAYGATAIPTLGGWRGSSFRTDSVENLIRSVLDVFQAFREEHRVTVIKLNVILIMLSST